MKTMTTLLTASALTLTSLSASAEIIDLPISVTFRDFWQAHPDFDMNGISGLTTGLVAETLDNENKPVYIGAGGGGNAAGNIDSAATFSTWYRDCDSNSPGSSCVGQYEKDIIATVDTTTGILTYDNDSFFPLDGVWTDTDVNDSHNYLFTAEFSLDLIYDPDNVGGNSFNFTGDDDVWVFINGQLVMDLGGIHPPTNGNFDLDEIITDDGGPLDIDPFEQYEFRFFFAERHVTQSNVFITSALGEPVNVPTPSTLILMAAGLIGIGTTLRRKR